jgi:predicted SprT family Zn-dependent metalloprotease
VRFYATKCNTGCAPVPDAVKYIHRNKQKETKVSPQQKQIVDNCKAVFAKAKGFWPHLDFSQVAIRFDLKGRAAGMAGRVYGDYYMRFNNDMLTREAFDHVLNDTVPHEIAHIVCYMDPRMGRKHDTGWARVCSMLGGSGNRFHKEEVVFGKGLTFEYVTTTGHKVRISQARHGKILRGVTYTYKNGMGKINKDCAHQIVGASGKTLANPLRKVDAKQPMNAPAAIEEAVRAPAVDPELQRANLARLEALRAKAAATGIPTPFSKAARVHVTSPAVPLQAPTAGSSKADVARALMTAGYARKDSYETIIAAIMVVNGHSKQLAKAYYKNNIERTGIPADYR